MDDLSGRGYGTLRPILKRFDIKTHLKSFQDKVLTSSEIQHPLQALGSEYQPDILRNHVDQFTVGIFIKISKHVSQVRHFLDNSIDFRRKYDLKMCLSPLNLIRNSFLWFLYCPNA